MARHRRNQQHLRIVSPAYLGFVTLEVQQLAERLLENDLFLDRNGQTVDFGFGQAELRLAIAPRQVFEHLAGRRHAPPHGCLAERVERQLHLHAQVMTGHPHRRDQGVSELIGMIVHRRTSLRTRSRRKFRIAQT